MFDFDKKKKNIYKSHHFLNTDLIVCLQKYSQHMLWANTIQLDLCLKYSVDEIVEIIN